MENYSSVKKISQLACLSIALYAVVCNPANAAEDSSANKKLIEMEATEILKQMSILKEKIKKDITEEKAVNDKNNDAIIKRLEAAASETRKFNDFVTKNNLISDERTFLGRSGLTPCLNGSNAEEIGMLSEQEKESDATAFGSGRIVRGDDSTLAIMQLGAGHVPIFKESCKGLRLGMAFSVAPSVESADPIDYGRQQLLLDDGGLFTATFSLSRNLFAAQSETSKSWRNIRASHIDRFYLASNRDNDQAWIYVVNGAVAKLVRETPNDEVSPRGQGTFYIGLGVDGPLFEGSASTPSGGFDIQGKISGNFLNKDSLEAIFGQDNRYSSFYMAGGVSATAYLAGKLNVSIEYQAALTGRNRRVLDSITMFSVGYNNGKQSDQQ